MDAQKIVPSFEVPKQERLNRLNSAYPKMRGQTSRDFMLAQQKIDRFCTSRFANAVAAGRILHSEEEVVAFASLSGELMAKADLAGVHNMATLKEFRKGL